MVQIAEGVTIHSCCLSLPKQNMLAYEYALKTHLPGWIHGCARSSDINVIAPYRFFFMTWHGLAGCDAWKMILTCWTAWLIYA